MNWRGGLGMNCGRVRGGELDIVQDDAPSGAIIC